MPTLAERFRRFFSGGDDEQKTGVSLTGFDFVSNGMGKVYYLGNAGPNEPGIELATAYAVSVLSHAAIRYRADNVSEPPLLVHELTDDGAQPIEHPLNELLAQPSDEYDMGETLWLTQASLDIYSRTLWVGESNGRRELAELIPWMGWETRVRGGRGRITDHFEILTGESQWQRRERDEVVYFRNLSPYSRTNAPSPTSVAMDWLGLSAKVRGAVDRMMANGMFPSVLIQPHQDWNPDDDEFKLYMARLRQYHSGPANAGKPFVQVGGGSATRLAFSLEDLLPDEIMDRIEATVAMAYGVAPVILGALVGLRNSPWSQMAEARRYTYEDTIVPQWRKIEKVLDRQLLRRLTDDPDLAIRFDTSEIVALQDDESQKIEDAKAATFWTLDQRLVHTGQEPIGGERGEWIEAVDKSSSPFGDLQLSDRRPVEPKAEAKQLRPTAWSMFDVMTKAQEPAWLRTTNRLLSDSEQRVVRAIKSSAFAWPKKDSHTDIDALVALLMDATQADVEWSGPISEAVTDTAKIAAQDAARTYGIRFDLADEAAVRYAKLHAARLVQGIEGTTRDRLRGFVSRGLDEGWSADRLTEEIQSTGPFTRARAELIARTEVTTVTNNAQLQTVTDHASDVGLRPEKAWLSARDGRVRPEHEKLDNGEYIDAASPFANGLMVPGEPNCRCTAIYRFEGD